MKTESKDIGEVSKRLDLVIALLLRGLPGKADAVPLREQIQILSDLGLRPKDIARILGRSQTYVGKELSNLRKAKAARKWPATT